jgi:hypothetical protein
MSRARHFILVMAAGALAALAAWPAGAMPATEHLKITTTSDSPVERVGERRWRDFDDSYRFRRHYDDYPRYGYYDRPYRYRYYDRPYRYGYYDYPYRYGFYGHPYRGFGIYAPGFVFRFGHGRGGFDRD